MSAYDAFASAYDVLNTEIDYDEMAERITSVLAGDAVLPGALVLDLGCGTGSLTSRLAERGFDMIAVDSSEEMLVRARDSVADESVLFLCQDITDFELYGTVAAVISTTDTLNHITDPDELRHTFALVRNYLDPDGLFIFDVNSPYKFSEIYGDHDYVLEDDGVLLAWQNDYDPDEGIADFYISLFEKTKTGSWKRTDSDFSERCYPLDTLCAMLSEAGFAVLSVNDAYTDKPVCEKTERYCFVCRRT